LTVSNKVMTEAASIATLSEEMRTRLAHLIRLLASDRDGEIVAAALALGRALRSVELDIHAIADLVLHGGKMPAVASMGPKPWQGAARRFLDHPHLLRHGEHEFLKNISRRSATPTEKQARWLADIEQRILRAAA
jgi:hypothetical protein